jgi:hypothetical protein
MDWLSKINPWVLLASVGMICLTAYGVIFLLVKYFKGFKRFNIGNVSVEKDGSVKVKKASLADEEIDRIAERIAGKVGHVCVQAQNIEQLMGGQRPMLEMVTALAADASARGVNGRVSAAQDGLEEYRAAHAKWADAKLAGVAP